MLSLILLKLTVQSVLADIPRDASSVVVYSLLFVFIGFVVAGSRSGSGAERPAGGGDE